MKFNPEWRNLPSSLQAALCVNAAIEALQESYEPKETSDKKEGEESDASR